MKKPALVGPLINLRFALIFILSIIIMFLDVRLKMMSDFRYYLETALYPVLVFADAPRQVSKAVSTQFKSRAELIEENERLASENYLQTADLMRLHSLEQENAAMRKLLNSPLHETSRRTFAEVVNVDSDPYLKRIVVNRGTSVGIYEGMPVITDEGLIGQVISTNYAFSRVLLLTDPSSSIPVVDTRNQVKALATGNGTNNELLINNVPRTADIQKGDILVTSGLGGVYPEGYPVGIVTEVGYSETQPFAAIKAQTLVNIDSLRYVLMVWYSSNSDEVMAIKPKERTDSKVVLRERRINKLIDSMTNTRLQNKDNAKDETNGKQSKQ